MSYIILSDSRTKKGEKIALVDRKRFKGQWWTERIEKAAVFTSKEIAETIASKIQHNNPKVYEYQKGKTRLGQVLEESSELERHLDWLQAREDAGFGSWDE